MTVTTTTPPPSTPPSSVRAASASGPSQGCLPASQSSSKAALHPLYRCEDGLRELGVYTQICAAELELEPSAPASCMHCALEPPSPTEPTPRGVWGGSVQGEPPRGRSRARVSCRGSCRAWGQWGRGIHADEAAADLRGTESQRVLIQQEWLWPLTWA